MRHPLIPVILAVLAIGLLPAASSAQQSRYSYSAGLMVGFGGSLDAEPDTEYDNFGFEAFFALETQPRTLFVTRIGQMSFEAKDSSVEFDLTYLTLSGEYLFSADYYDSGIFLGLGLYDLSGDRGLADDSGLGLTVGVTGDFRITDRLSFVAQFSGHYADLDYAQFFVMGHAGVAYHF